MEEPILLALPRGVPLESTLYFKLSFVGPFNFVSCVDPSALSLIRSLLLLLVVPGGPLDLLLFGCLKIAAELIDVDKVCTLGDLIGCNLPPS